MTINTIIPKTPIVLIDMDDVLADFGSEFLSRVSQRHPHISMLDKRKNFYIPDDYPEDAELLWQMAKEEGFFKTLPLVDNALVGWQRIIDLGYHPQICSSPLQTNPLSKSEKLSWLTKNLVPLFGKSVAEEALITSDKHQCEGIALIDDRPKIRDSKEAAWQHIIFDMPYNQESSAPRLFGWLDSNLPSLLKAAASRFKLNN
ncbi:MAG: 5' nucleotidase, NT5C type [Candidatus Saccharimonadales bacterium]